MRMRKKPNLSLRMERCEELLIRDPAAMRGRWRELRPAAREVRLEIGCGKGRFSAETAEKNPDILYIALERVPDAMVIAAERARELGLYMQKYCGCVFSEEERYCKSKKPKAKC